MQKTLTVPAKSVRQFIETATTVADVNLWLSKALSYRKISPRTIRKCELAAEKRIKELGGAK